MPIDSSFGKRHENITRSYDLVGLWYHLCPIGHRSYSLGSAGFVYLFYPGYPGSSQNHRSHLPVSSRGSAHYDLGNPGALCRNDIHKYS